MATTDIKQVDIKLMLGRLRPASEYQWKVSSDLGNTLDEAVGDWRDKNTQPPTEAQLLTEWDAYVIERAAVATVVAAKVTDLSDVRAGQVQAALDQIQADLTLLGSAPTNAQVLLIVGRCLQRQSRIIKALRWLAL